MTTPNPETLRALADLRAQRDDARNSYAAAKRRAEQADVEARLIRKDFDAKQEAYRNAVDEAYGLYGPGAL